MERSLVLSLFPGIGLLDRAFEEEGFTVVRGPDVLWGGDVRRFHAPSGVFAGVIGGPPCQLFSALRHINPNVGRHGNLIPEYERVVAEAQPAWFVMENVKDAPEPVVPGYVVRSLLLNNRWVCGGDGIGPEQNRLRRFSFGTRDGKTLNVEVALFEAPLMVQAVTSAATAVPVKLVRDGEGGHRPKATVSRGPTGLSGHDAAPGQRDRLRASAPTVTGTGIPPSKRGQGEMPISRMCELQGLPPDFADEMPFTAHGIRRVIGNGVPLQMGRAIARAVKAALAAAQEAA